MQEIRIKRGNLEKIIGFNLQGGKANVVFQEVQARCFHVSPLAAAAVKTAMSKFDSDPLPYDKLVKNLEVVKKRLNRPLTLSEKVLYSHLDKPDTQVKLPRIQSISHSQSD